MLRENSNYDAIILGSDIQIKEPEVPLYALAWKDVQVSKEKKQKKTYKKKKKTHMLCDSTYVNF